VGIENFISVKETEGHKLATGLEQHVTTYDVDVMNLQRAEALTPGDLIEIRLSSGAALRAKSVVIATGARWREINVPGEREYRNRGVAYCPHCDGPLFKGKRVAVIGGGNSGVEAAIDLAGLVSHVTIIEYDAQLRAERRADSQATQSAERHGDHQRADDGDHWRRKPGDVVDIQGTAERSSAHGRTCRSLRADRSGAEHRLVEGNLETVGSREIEVDARGQTSVPGVFAAGDCTIVPYKQIVIAMGEGAKASLSAFDHLIRTPLSAAA